MSAVATKGEIKNLAARPGGGKTTTKRVAREKILAGIPIVTNFDEFRRFLINSRWAAPGFGQDI